MLFRSYAIFLVLTASISSSGRPKVSTIAGFLSMACLLILSIALVPLYSIEGAAIASAISFFIAMALSAAYVLFKFKSLMPAKSLVKIVFAGIVIFVLSEAMGSWTGLLVMAKAVLLGLAYLAILAVSKEFGKKELGVFLSMIR